MSSSPARRTGLFSKPRARVRSCPRTGSVLLIQPPTDRFEGVQTEPHGSLRISYWNPIFPVVPSFVDNLNLS